MRHGGWSRSKSNTPVNYIYIDMIKSKSLLALTLLQFVSESLQIKSAVQTSAAHVVFFSLSFMPYLNCHVILLQHFCIQQHLISQRFNKPPCSMVADPLLKTSIIGRLQYCLCFITFICLCYALRITCVCKVLHKLTCTAICDPQSQDLSAYSLDVPVLAWISCGCADFPHDKTGQSSSQCPWPKVWLFNLLPGHCITI